MESNSAKAYKESHKKFGMKGLYTVTVDLVLSFMDEASTRGDQSLKDRVDGMATKARQALKVAVAGMVMEYGAQQKAKFKNAMEPDWQATLEATSPLEKPDPAWKHKVKGVINSYVRSAEKVGNTDVGGHSALVKLMTGQITAIRNK
ncbi:hypothetical protein PG991_007687 [Apiospora marii]|uniref:Uncharacterized protein n=1 Tax=Apiospora marii TaxID=335849 RepID=A0ABR1RUC2_9PEZI